MARNTGEGGPANLLINNNMKTAGYHYEPGDREFESFRVRRINNEARLARAAVV